MRALWLGPIGAAGWSLLVALVLAVACSPGPTAGQTLPKSPATSPSPSPGLSSPRPAPSPTHTPVPTPPPSASTPMFIYIYGSDYGEVAATTLVGAACSANATMPDGRRIELGGQTANQLGDVHWTYPPKSPAAQGQGMHAVSCRLGSQTATSSVSFDVGS